MRRDSQIRLDQINSSSMSWVPNQVFVTNYVLHSLVSPYYYERLPFKFKPMHHPFTVSTLATFFKRGASAARILYL